MSDREDALVAHCATQMRGQMTGMYVSASPEIGRRIARRIVLEAAEVLAGAHTQKTAFDALVWAQDRIMSLPTMEPVDVGPVAPAGPEPAEILAVVRSELAKAYPAAPAPAAAPHGLALLARDTCAALTSPWVTWALGLVMGLLLGVRS